ATFRFEPVLALGPLRLLQTAVETIGPRVVRALQRLAAPRSLHHGMASVTADIDEAPQHAVPPADDRDRDPARHHREETAGVCHLLRAPCVLPAHGEDALVLAREDGG